MKKSLVNTTPGGIKRANEILNRESNAAVDRYEMRVVADLANEYSTYLIARGLSPSHPEGKLLVAAGKFATAVLGQHPPTDQVAREIAELIHDYPVEHSIDGVPTVYLWGYGIRQSQELAAGDVAVAMTGLRDSIGLYGNRSMGESAAPAAGQGLSAPGIGAGPVS